MKLENKIMLITYADSMGKNINELHQVLDKHYRNAVGGVHILPFFPSSADRGFAPMRYDKVDEAFGTFEDIDKLGENYYLMFDFMVNHISAQSEYFKDYLKNNPIVLYTDLIEPQEIELTAAEVDALRTLQTFNGVTNISNSTEAEMSVKYCTNKALSEHVLPIAKGLQVQIDELRAAVLSLGGNV